MPPRVGFFLGLIVGASTSYLAERITGRVLREYDALMARIDLTQLTD